MINHFRPQRAKHKNLRKIKAVAATMLVCGGWLSTPLIAQDAETSLLEEVIVTAQRREERLIDVPVSITVLSGDFLDSSMAFGLEDIVGWVPNVLFINLDSTSSTLLTLRGFGSDTTNPGLESGVAVYHDGVYLGRSAAFNSALLDLERVEVLRGPQGTLFGRNSILGAFNIVSQKPTDQLEGSVEVSLGNYDLKQTKAVLNLPVNDSLALRFSGIYRDHEGYLDNALTGTTINDRESWGGRMQALYQATDNLEFIFSIDGQSDRSNGAAMETSFDPEDRASLTDRVVSVSEGIDDRDIWGTSLTANYSFGENMLTSITAYRETKFDLIVDADHTELPALVGTSIEDQSQFSQEIRIDSPAGDRLTWTMGVYYFTQDYDRDNGFDVAGFAFGLPFDVKLAFASAEKTTAYAFFGNGTYDLTDQWSVSLGLRYTHETKDFDYVQRTLPFDLGGPPFVDIGPISDKESWDNWSPSLVFNYAWREDLNTYAKVVRGFKSGGFNSFLAASPDLTAFDPEYITSYEIGLKSMHLDNRLMFNIAGFYLDYTDIQINLQDPFTGESIVINEGELSSVGFELDMTVRPVQGLDLMASLGYIDVREQQGPEPANQPKWNGSLSGQYSWALGGRFQAVVRGDLQYRSPFHSTRAHIFDNGSVLLANARVGIEMPQGNWGVYLWGRNLTDKTVISNTVPDNPIRSNLEPPRTYGIEARFNF